MDTKQTLKHLTSQGASHDDPLASYGIVRVRPMSAVESACGCRPCIVATPLLSVATNKNDNGDGNLNNNTYSSKLGGGSGGASAGSFGAESDTASNASGVFGRRARRTMSVFSHAPTFVKTAAMSKSGGGGGDDDTTEDGDDPSKLQQKLLGKNSSTSNNQSASLSSADGNASSSSYWREEWVEPMLAADAPDAASSDVQYSATIQRTSPSSGGIDAHTFRLTHCLAPERVAVPVVSAPPGTQMATAAPSPAAVNPSAATDGAAASSSSSSPPNSKTAILYAHPTQSQVYDTFGPAVVQGALRGQRQTVVVYGATGTGKSYTVWGNNNEPGIVPQILKSLVSKFNTSAGSTTDSGSSSRRGGASPSYTPNEQVLRGRGKLKEILVSMFDINANEKVTDLLKLRLMDDELMAINLTPAAASVTTTSTTSNSTDAAASANGKSASSPSASSAALRRSQQIHTIVEQLSTIGVGTCPEDLNATLEILRGALSIRNAKQQIKHSYAMRQDVDVGDMKCVGAGGGTNAAASGGGSSSSSGGSSASSALSLTALEQPLDLLEVIANGNPFPTSTATAIMRNDSTYSFSSAAAGTSKLGGGKGGAAFAIADADQPAASPVHHESTLTTVIRIEVLVSGGKTVVSAPILTGSSGGGKNSSGGAAITTLSTVEADDLIGRIDIVECAGSEWLAAPSSTSAASSSSSYDNTINNNKNNTTSNNNRFSSTTSSIMAAAVKGAATEAVSTSTLVNPIECQGLTVKSATHSNHQSAADDTSSAATDTATTLYNRKNFENKHASKPNEPPLPFASLRYLHRSLLLLAATTGNAKQQAAAIGEALSGSLLTEYLSEVLNPQVSPAAAAGSTTTPSSSSSSSAPRPLKPFDGRLFFIGTVSGADGNAQFEQTVDTLRIADGVTRIGTFPTAKRDRKLEYAAELKEQIEKAKRQLAAIDEANAVKRYGSGGSGSAINNNNGMNLQQSAFDGGNTSSSSSSGTESVLAKVAILRQLAKATERYQELTRNQEERARWLQAARQRVHLMLMEKLVEYRAVTNEITIMQTALIAGWPTGGSAATAASSSSHPIAGNFSASSIAAASSSGSHAAFTAALAHMVQRYSDQVMAREAIATASTAPSLVQMVKGRKISLHPSSLLYRIGGLQYNALADTIAATNLAGLLAVFQTTYGSSNSNGGAPTHHSAIHLRSSRADPNNNNNMNGGRSNSPTGSAASTAPTGTGSPINSGVQLGSGGRRRNAAAMIAAGNAIMFGADGNAINNNNGRRASVVGSAGYGGLLVVKTPAALLQHAVPPLVVEVLHTLVTGIRCGAIAPQVLQAAQKLLYIQQQHQQQAIEGYYHSQLNASTLMNDKTNAASSAAGLNNATPPVSPRDQFGGRVFANVSSGPRYSPVALPQVALFSHQLQTCGSSIAQSPLLVCLNPTTSTSAADITATFSPRNRSNSKGKDGNASPPTSSSATAVNADGSSNEHEGGSNAPFMLSTAGCYVSLFAPNSSGTSTVFAAAAATDSEGSTAPPPPKQPILLPPFYSLREGGTSMGAFATAPHIATDAFGGGGVTASTSDAELAELQHQVVADQQTQYYFSANTNGTSCNTIHSRIALPVDALNGGKKISSNSSAANNGTSSSPSSSSSSSFIGSSIAVLYSSDTVVARLDVDHLRQEVRLWTISSRDNMVANAEATMMRQQQQQGSSSGSALKSSTNPSAGGRKGRAVTFGPSSGAPTNPLLGGGGSSGPIPIPPDIEVTVNGIPLKAITVQPSSSRNKTKGSTGAGAAALDESNFMLKDGYLLKHRDRIVIGNIVFQLLLPATWESVRNGIEAPPLIAPEPDPFLMIAQAAANASLAAEKKRRKQLEDLLNQQHKMQQQSQGDRSGIENDIKKLFTDHQALVLDQLARAANAFCSRAPRIGPTMPPRIATTTVCTVNNRAGGKKELRTTTEVLGPNEEPMSTSTPSQPSKAVPAGGNVFSGANRNANGGGAGGDGTNGALVPTSNALTDVTVDGVPIVITANVLPATLPAVDNAAKQPVHTVPVPAISMTATRRLIPMLFQRGVGGRSYGSAVSNGHGQVTTTVTKQLTPEAAMKLFEDPSEAETGNSKGNKTSNATGANFSAKVLPTGAQAADASIIPSSVREHLKVCDEAVHVLDRSNPKDGFANPNLLMPRPSGDTKTAIKLNASGGTETVVVTMTTPVPALQLTAGSAGGGAMVVSSKDPAVAQALALIKCIRRAKGDDAADAFAAQQNQLAAAIAAVANSVSPSANKNNNNNGGVGGMGGSILASLAAMGISLPLPVSMGTLTALSCPRQTLLIEAYERHLIMLLESCWFYERVSNAKAALQAMADAQLQQSRNGALPSAIKGSSSKASSVSLAQSLADTAANAANFMRFRSFATETVFRLSFIENQLITEFPNEKALANVAIGGPADRLALFSFEGGDIADPRSLIRFQEMVKNRAIEAENNRISIASAAAGGPKKKAAAAAAALNDDTDSATGLPKWVSTSGGAPPILSSTEAFEAAIIEARRFGDAAMLKCMLEQSELLRRASTIFAFVNPSARKKKNADGSDPTDDPSSTALLGGKNGKKFAADGTSSPEEILALKQRLFAHLREQEGSAPDTLGDLLDSIETFMNGRIAKALFSEDELNALRNASYDDKETMKLAVQVPPSDAELYDLARKALASPNIDAAQIAEAIRFRIDYELRDFKKRLQASREWLPDGPSNAFARKEWQRLCLEKHQNPKLQEVRENWEYDEEGGCVRGECGPLIGPDGQYVTKENRQKVFGSNPHAPEETVAELNPSHSSNYDANGQIKKGTTSTSPKGSTLLAQPPFFEAYFFKLRVRRTLFHRGGGFHLVYGILRGRFLYYFPECFPHHNALGGAYLFGAKIERTSMGVRQYCLRITLAVQRKESKSASDPSENEIMMCFDTESELTAWHDQLIKASIPEVGATLKQYFGETQLSRFVQDSQLVEIVELDRKAEEALQKSRSLFSIGNFSIGGLSPTAVGAVVNPNSSFTFHQNGSVAGSEALGSPRSNANASMMSSSSPTNNNNNTSVRLNGGLPGATDLVTASSFSAHFGNKANLAILQQQRGLIQRDPAKYRARAIMLALSASLGINPTQSLQISRKTTNLRVGELEGGYFSAGEQRAIALLAADLSIAHYQFGGRKGYILKDYDRYGDSSPSERLLMPILPRPLIPSYERAQTAYAVLAAVSAFMNESPKKMSDIGVPSTGIRITTIHNARELKKYFKTTIAPNSNPPPATAAPTSAMKGAKAKKGQLPPQPQSRLWLLDTMGGTIQLIDFKGSKAHVYEDRQLVRMERSSVDSRLLHLTFFNNGHHMFAEYFPTAENREEFCCLVDTMKPSGRVYCPPLAAPPPNSYSTIYGVVGEKIEVYPFADPAAEPLVIEGEGQVRASKDPLQKLSVWTGTFNVTGFPIHNPDTLERWIPLNEEHDIYCVCLQEVSYRRGEQQLFSYIQRYFEEPNPAINSVIIAPRRYVELTAKEMGDKEWQREMMEATRDSVTTKHNATVLPQQKRVLKTDNELRKLNYIEEVRNKPRYRLVAKVGLFDIQMAVFARTNHWLACSNIETTTYSLSPPCYSGERGAVACAFDVNGTSFCFTGVHLPGLRTPEHDAARRGLSYELLSGLSFGNRSFHGDITNQFDFFFALGDFNAPLRTATRKSIMHLHEAQAKGTLSEYVSENCLMQREMAIDPQAVLQEAHDAAEARSNGANGSGGNSSHGVNLFTLLGGTKTKDLMFSDDGHLLNSGMVLSGFREPTINFMPTNCIDIATGKYNIAKVLAPNYPDRILVKVPVHLTPLLNDEGEIDKLMEINDDGLGEDEDEEEEDEEEKLNKLVSLDEEVASEKKSAADEGEAGEETEEREEDEEGDEDDAEDDNFLGGGGASGKKKEEAGALVPSSSADAFNAQQKSVAIAPQSEDVGTSVYPIQCTSYTSNTQMRLSEHFPVSATFIVNVPRPIGFIFMSNVRRAVILISDLRMTGVVFPFAKQGVFTGAKSLNPNNAGDTGGDNGSGGSMYGETASPPTSPRRVRIADGPASAPAGANSNNTNNARYRPIDDAQPSSLAMELSVNNHYLDPAVTVHSAAYDIARFSSLLQDAATAAVAPPCRFTAAYPKEIELRMAIPTTPDHFMHSNLSLTVYDQHDNDLFRARRGSARLSLMNFAGPVEAHVQKILRSTPTWDLMPSPFKCPLEMGGNRMGYATGFIAVSYERLDDYNEDEEEHQQQQN